MDETQYWDFLKQIAQEVDRLVINPQKMDTFRQKVKPFVERWKQHNKDTGIAEAKRKEHWQKVKSNPAWQDKKAGSPKRGWEWDRGYLFNLPPIAKMPTERAPAVIAAIEEDIEGIKKQKQQCAETSREYRKLDEALTKRRENLADIHSELDKLNANVIPTKICVQFRWWELIDVGNEEVFGCWRPPLGEIRPNPLIMLCPESKTGFLPKPIDTVQEYERYYIVLTSVHDNMLPETESISREIWPEELANVIWRFYIGREHYYSDGKFIGTAFDHVQDDLVEKTETEGNATLKSKIKDFLWTLYEKTLKVVVDAVMERWWPK